MPALLPRCFQKSVGRGVAPKGERQQFASPRDAHEDVCSGRKLGLVGREVTVHKPEGVRQDRFEVHDLLISGRTAIDLRLDDQNCVHSKAFHGMD